MLYGREVSETNTKHLQGMVCFDNAKSFSAVKKLIKDAHWEACKSVIDSINYCKKDGDFFVKGEEGGQGTRNDLKKALKNNETIADFKKNEPVLFCKYRNGIKELYTDKLKAGVFNPDKEVIYITGNSGLGKTQKARTECPEPKSEIEFKNSFLLGFKEGSENIIYDEFRDSELSIKDFLKLTDKYSNTFNIKGGDTVIDVKKIYITSIKSPFDIYKNIQEDRTQIYRRITKLILMDENGEHDITEALKDIENINKRKKNVIPLTQHEKEQNVIFKCDLHKEQSY